MTPTDIQKKVAVLWWRLCYTKCLRKLSRASWSYCWDCSMEHLSFIDWDLDECPEDSAYEEAQAMVDWR